MQSWLLSAGFHGLLSAFFRRDSKLAERLAVAAVGCSGATAKLDAKMALLLDGVSEVSVSAFRVFDGSVPHLLSFCTAVVQPEDSRNFINF